MNSQLRIGHFSPDAPAVDIHVDGEPLLEGVSFGTLGDYVDVDAGSYDVEIVPAAGGDAVLSATLDLENGVSYTVLAVNALADIEALVLTDDQPVVDAGDARLRFVHTVPDAPAVDIWAGDEMLFENVAFGEGSAFATVDADAYDIDVRPAGADDDVLSLAGVGLDDATSYTMLATGMLDESLDAVLVADYVTTEADDRTVAP
ncbi:MAG: DUF4397 domain-containing protein [Haloarcula sp.]